MRPRKGGAVSRWLWRARPASLDTSTQMASDNRCGDGTPVQLLSTEPDQLGELKRMISDK
jgi:hypothetical protein